MTKTDQFVKKLIAMTLSNEIEWTNYSCTGSSYFWEASISDGKNPRTVHVQETRFPHKHIVVNKTLVGGPSGEKVSANFDDSKYDLDLIKVMNDSKSHPDWVNEFLEEVLE